MSKSKDLIGQKFGELTVIANTGLRCSNGCVLWLVRCLCGKELKKTSGSFKRTKNPQRSCGCIPHKYKVAGEGSLRNAYLNYRNNAKNHKKNFQLTMEQFKFITSQNCFYCNLTPKQTTGKLRNDRPNYYHNGIDRVNSSIGYVLENCVPCCKQCNYSKRDMSKEEFKTFIKRVYECLYKETN